MLFSYTFRYIIYTQLMGMDNVLLNNARYSAYGLPL